MSEAENPFKTRSVEAAVWVDPDGRAKVKMGENVAEIGAALVSPPKETGEQVKDILELVADLEGKVLGLRSNVDVVASRNTYLEEHGGMAPTTHLVLARATADVAVKATARRCAEIMLKFGTPAESAVLLAIRQEFGL